MAQAQRDAIGAHPATLRGYIIGFVSSIILTAVAFAMVIANSLPRGVIVFGIYCAATVQILVQLRYFLHIDRSSALRWNVLALMFTLLIMSLFVLGTLWIMSNLNYRIM